MAMILGWMIMIPVSTLAFWRKEMILYVVSGIITILFSLTYIDTLGGGIALMLCGLGVFELGTALTLVLVSGGSARGWSQFKGIYHRVMGK